MPYTPSLREIPLTEDPHASALEAIQGDVEDVEESPGELDWSDQDAVDHVRICKQCQHVLGVNGNFNTGESDITDGGVTR